MTEQEATPHGYRQPRDVSEDPDSASGVASYSVAPKVRVERCACGWPVWSVDLEPFILEAVQHHNALPIHLFWRERQGVE